MSDKEIRYQPKTNDEVIEAVEFYCQKIKEGRVKEAIQRYGDVNTWDVSLFNYKDMKELLNHRSKFDENDPSFDARYVSNVMTFLCFLIGRSK